jgi:hypothetical protein
VLWKFQKQGDNMNTIIKKNIIKLFLLIFIPVTFSCVGGVKASSNVTFTEIQDRQWNLAEVRNGSVTISIDRTNVPRMIYTIKFEKNRVIGTGAKNSYSARYIAGENHALVIGSIASDRAAPMFEMEDFSEHEYFLHLERVYRWGFRNGKLELHTYDENRNVVILVFF